MVFEKDERLNSGRGKKLNGDFADSPWRFSLAEEKTPEEKRSSLRKFYEREIAEFFRLCASLRGRE